MGDNGDDRLNRLFAAARSADMGVSPLEEHFETRLMARIAERKVVGQPWYLLAWQMLPGFAVATLLTVACSIALNPSRSSDLFAGITVGSDDRITISYLAGE